MVVALDSVVIVAFLDRSHVFHDAADRAITGSVAQRRLLASVVTYAELLTGAHLGHRDASLVRGFFARLIADLRPVDRDVAERAAELRSATTALRLPDALILATADLHADAVVTADVRWASVPALRCAVRTLDGPR